MDRTQNQPTNPKIDVDIESGSFISNAHESTKKWLGKACASLVIMAGAVTLSACSEGEAQPPAPTSSSSAEATPSPEATESATPDRYKGTDFELTEALPESLEYLNAATPEEFAQAPKKEQLAWLSWAEQYKSAFVEMFAAVSGLENDKPYTLTLDSDLNTIFRDMQYTDRLAANFGTGTPKDRSDNGQLDKNMVIKLRIAHQARVDLGEAETYYNNLSTFSEGEAINLSSLARGGLYDTADKAATSPDLNALPQNMTFDSKWYDGYKYSFSDPESNTGITYVGQVSVVEYVDFRGNTAYTVLTF